MMEVKKNKTHDLEQKRPLFFGIGMTVALALAITAFEWKTTVEPIVMIDEEVSFDPLYLPPVTKIPEPPKPKPIAVKPVEVPDEVQVEDTPLIDSDPYVPVDDPVDFIPVEPDEPVPDFFTFAESMPSFQGGMEAFYKFLGKKIKYPKQAKRMGIEGRVYVQFIIEEDGSISNIKTIKGIGVGCDEEAERVMGLVPNFIPGKQRGVPVRVQMVIPIHFQLN